MIEFFSVEGGLRSVAIADVSIKNGRNLYHDPEFAPIAEADGEESDQETPPPPAPRRRPIRRKS